MNDFTNLEWWENHEAKTVDNVEEPLWSPPKLPNLLEAVHKRNVTHIKSPFHHLRYPHEFKTKEYYKYKECVDEKPADSPEEPIPEPPVVETKKLNVQLEPPRQHNHAYLEYFKKKSLRKRIYDGEVAFYEDYVEAEIARDYCRLFGKPFRVPRHDWGGENYFFGEKVIDQELETQRDEIQEEAEPPVEIEPVTPKLRDCDLRIMSSTNLSETKKQELLKGEIPSLFPAQQEFVQRKKNRWISFHNLRTHAYMIDSVTKCPLLHVQLQKTLQTGWKSQPKKSLHYHETVEPEPVNPYALTREQIERANAILKERMTPVPEDIPDVGKLVKSKKYGINENCSTVGGGRYLV